MTESYKVKSEKTPELEAFVRELYALLDKHDATIVRSASDKSELVISLQVAWAFHEFTFQEEIGTTTIIEDYFDGLGGANGFLR